MTNEHDDRNDAGTATLFVAVFLALSVVLILATGKLGQRIVQHAQLEAAADAVALAAVLNGADAAQDIAAENAVHLVAVDLRAGWAQVTVERDGSRVTSSAAASAAPERDEPGNDAARLPRTSMSR